MTLPEAILAVVRTGGIVKYPYKDAIDSWMGEAVVARCDDDRRGLPPQTLHIVEWPDGYRSNFASAEEAVAFFCGLVFCRKNIGLACYGIDRAKVREKDWDRMTEAEVLNLVEWYFSSHWFAEDFPCAVVEKG